VSTPCPASLHFSGPSSPFPAPGRSSPLVCSLASDPVLAVLPVAPFPFLRGFSPASESFPVLCCFSLVKGEAQLCSWSPPGADPPQQRFHGKSPARSPFRARSLVPSAILSCCAGTAGGKAWSLTQSPGYSHPLCGSGGSTRWRLCP